MTVASITRSALPIRPSVTLRNGDRLDRATFHALCSQMPEDFRAELVGGVVYVASPVSRRHAEVHGGLVAWLTTYAARTPGVGRADNGSVFVTDDDEPQPDALLYVRPECGGRVHYEGDYRAGGPDFVGEVATSSVAIDLNRKFDAYERAGVREYVVLATRESDLFWFERRDGRFVRRDMPADGVFRSAVFSGLWLNAAAALADDAAAVLDTLGAGLADPAHAAFVAELATRRKT